MTTAVASDAVPAPIRDLAALFTDALVAVKFPDVDAEALAAAVGRVDALAENVARLEEQLAQARLALETGSADLARLATRAHAYARVFADDNDDLRTRVDAITLPRPRAPRGSASSSASSSSTSSSSSSSSSSGSASGASPTGSSASSTSAGSSPGADDAAGAATTSSRRKRNKTGTDDGQQLFAGSPE